MYVLLDKDLRVKEIIPDINPIFPDMTIEQLYSKEFLDKLQHINDDIEIGHGYKYNTETNVWEYVDPPEIPVEDPERTTEARLSNLESDNKVLKAQLEAAIQSNQMLEECLVEMAGIVYA